MRHPFPGCGAARSGAPLVRGRPRLGIGPSGVCNDPGSATRHFVPRRARETEFQANMRRRFFVYILANRPKGVLYVGVTNDLARRAWEHKNKIATGFTSTYGVIRLVYFEEYETILDARARERALKRWRRAWKFKLVEDVNPSWRDLYDELVMH
jgi:putative endonuclease